eukprot:COSAG02_NODE_31931_length_525_cov_0.699531_2_plen_70_part_01
MQAAELRFSWCKRSRANRLIYIIYIWLRVGAQCGATGTVGIYAERLDQLRLLSVWRFLRMWARKRKCPYL